MGQTEETDGLTRREAVTLLGGGLLAATAAGFGLTGCGRETVAPNQLASADFANAPLTAILRQSFVTEHQTLLDQQLADFNDMVNAELSLRHRPDWRERYLEVARKRQGADIAEFFSHGSHIHADRLTDLSALAEEIGASNGGWLDIARTTGTVDGRWVTIPWSFTPSVINYRIDHAAEISMGPPVTYEDLLEMATRLKEADLPMSGFSMSAAAPNDSANFAYSILWAFGAQEVDPSTGKVALDSQATRSALDYFMALSKVNHPAAPGFDEAGNNDAFLSGQISMTQNTSSIYWKARAESPELAEVMGHVPYPSGPAGAHQLVEVNSLGVFSHSRNQAAAQEWIRFACQPEQLRPLSEVALGSLIPPLENYQDDPTMPWNLDSNLRGMVSIAENSHLTGWPGSPTAESAYVLQNGSIVAMFSEVAAGRSTPDEAIAVAAAELKRVYET